MTDSTGRHAIPPPPQGDTLDQRIADAVASHDKKRSRDNFRTITAPILVGCAVLVIGGSVSFYAQSAAVEASTDQRIGEAERRIEVIEDRMEDVRDLQRDVTALSTKVDAWRQSDTAARAVEREAWERRLTRFERLLEERRR